MLNAICFRIGRTFAPRLKPERLGWRSGLSRLDPGLNAERNCTNSREFNSCQFVPKSFYGFEVAGVGGGWLSFLLSLDPHNVSRT